MAPFGLKLGPNEAESFLGPYGSPPGLFWAHFGPKNLKNDKNPKIQKSNEIWTLEFGKDMCVYAIRMFAIGVA